LIAKHLSKDWENSVYNRVRQVLEESKRAAATSHEVALEQAEQASRLAESQRRINEFKVTRPHYEKVVGIMTNLIRAGQAQDLDDSYEQAILLHPETKQEVIREQVEAQRKAEAEAAKATADKAAEQAKRDRRATSTNVRATNTQRGGGAARPTTGTVDDTLRATLDAIRGRDG
jgi:colicin import membrane protein